MATPESQAQIFFDKFRIEREKAATGDATAKDLVTRLKASPKFVRLVKAGDPANASWAKGEHEAALKIMKDGDANYNPHLDGKAMKFFEEVDKAYAAQKPTPKFTDHKVEKDATLSKIVGEHYGLKDATEIDTAYRAVARSNGIANPDVISEGQTIKLPETLPLTAAQIATVPSAIPVKATRAEITQAVKTLQVSVFGPEKDASGKQNPEVDGILGRKTAGELHKAHGDLNNDADVDKLDDNLKAAVKTLRDNGYRGLFDQGKPAAAPTATPTTTPPKATKEEITQAVKTLQEDVFGPEIGPDGKKNPKVDGMFGPLTAKALRDKHKDINVDANFNNLSPDLQAAVQTLRENEGPGLFNQDKIQAKRISDAFKGGEIKLNGGYVDPNTGRYYATPSVAHPVNPAFKGAAEGRETGEQFARRLDETRDPLNDQGYKKGGKINTAFGGATQGNTPVPPSPSAGVTITRTGRTLDLG